MKQPEEKENIEQLKRCTYCGRPIDMPAKNMEEIEKLAISNAGRSIYYAVLERSLRSIDLCNQCYSMMQAYRHSLSWEERGYNEREYQPKFTPPEAADINVAHLAADKAIPEWEELLGAIARGWCHPENAKKVMDEKLALAIGEEVKSFIRKLIKQQRSEVAREMKEEIGSKSFSVEEMEYIYDYCDVEANPELFTKIEKKLRARIPKYIKIDSLSAQDTGKENEE